MKRLVLISEELDGHSGATAVIVTSQKEYDLLLKQTLYRDNEIIYTFDGEDKKSEKETIFYYTGEMGYLSLSITCFNTYKEIENREFFTRTG